MHGMTELVEEGLHVIVGQKRRLISRRFLTKVDPIRGRGGGRKEDGDEENDARRVYQREEEMGREYREIGNEAGGGVLALAFNEAS